MDRKKIIYFLIGISLLGIFVYGFLSVQRESLNITPGLPYSKQLPEPSIPNFISGKLPVSMSIKKEDFNFPAELGLLGVSSETIKDSDAKQIATNLQFPEEPLIVNDVREGTKFIWSTSKKFLFITPSTGTIKYGLNTPEPPEVTNKKLSLESLIETVKSILSQNKIVQQEEIKISSIDYLKVNPISEGFQKTTQTEAEVYQLNFTYKNSDYEILTLLPSKPLIFVQLLPDGSVFNLEVIHLKGVVNTNEKYAIKNYEDVLNDLENAKIVNLFNDRINLSEIKVGKIRSIEIDQIKLSYLLDSPSSKNLQPVFLLEGSINILDSSANRVQLYLPAIKNP